MRAEWFLNVTMGILVLCALLITALVVRRELFQGTREVPATSTALVADWREYAASGHRMGPADAPVTVVMFSDFQCPFCAVAAERLRTLRQAYPGEVSLVYRHFPLRNHPHALAAARASECAAAQGRFAAYHDALFARQDSIGVISWDRFAAIAGVEDPEAFGRCAASSSGLAALERDTLAARQLQVTGTPTLLVNEVQLQGVQPLDTLVAHIERALGARRENR